MLLQTEVIIETSISLLRIAKFDTYYLQLRIFELNDDRCVEVSEIISQNVEEIVARCAREIDELDASMIDQLRTQISALL